MCFDDESNMDAGSRPLYVFVAYLKNTFFLTDNLLLHGRLRLFGRLFRFSHGVKGRWEDVVTPLPLRDVNSLPAVTVVAVLADVQLVQLKRKYSRNYQR